jgi:hypothetical protein
MTTKSKNLGKEQTTVDVPFQNLAKLLVYNKLPASDSYIIRFVS